MIDDLNEKPDLDEFCNGASYLYCGLIEYCQISRYEEKIEKFL